MKQTRRAAKASAYRLAVRTLKVVNPGDITIRHHWTGDPLRLHSFRHMWYWHKGTARERDTMVAFAQLLRPGDSVVEIGGHIGYLAMWIATLVGDSGNLIVCEPGSNNLPYLRQNMKPYKNAMIRDIAVADESGMVSFFEEELSGQNNSILLDAETFRSNQKSRGVSVETRVRTVHAARLDDIVASMSSAPQLVKVDVEGAELKVLMGAQRVLTHDRPAWVIEVSRNQREIERLFCDAGYVTLYPSLQRSDGFDDTCRNYVCLHSDAHQQTLKAIGLS